ncbi:MAG TPA: class I adenylate-forming enzyme family protein, partial [Vicinamibacterales bacterium]|nr:class I adenylate-forming enzyme family protein [Vicinamibacterales bacterium]
MTTDITLVSDVIRRSAATWPARIAVQTADGACRLTYAELRDHVERGASRLLALGLEPGARVLLTAEPSPYWIASFLAIAHAGLIAVPIPSNTSAALVQLVAVHAKVRVCIADHAGSRLASALTGLRFIAAADLTAPGVEPVARASTRPAEKTAVLVFTSGSTARPRAVRLSHAALRANLRSLQEMRHAEPGETLLSTLPPSHAYELVAGQLAPLSAGARVVY